MLTKKLKIKNIVPDGLKLSAQEQSLLDVSMTITVLRGSSQQEIGQSETGFRHINQEQLYPFWTQVEALLAKLPGQSDFLASV